MRKTCYFCGTKCTSIGRHAYWPQNGYDLCAECSRQWTQHGKLDYLLGEGPPNDLFRIKGATLSDDESSAGGVLIFFDMALAFVADEQKPKPNLAFPTTFAVLVGSPIGMALAQALSEGDRAAAIIGGAIGGGLGGVVAFAIQDAILAARTRRAPSPSGDITDRLRGALGLAVIKRVDIQSIDYDKTNGLVITTPCQKYDKLNITGEAWQRWRADIEEYVSPARPDAPHGPVEPSESSIGDGIARTELGTYQRGS